MQYLTLVNSADTESQAPADLCGLRALLRLDQNTQSRVPGGKRGMVATVAAWQWSFIKRSSERANPKIRTPPYYSFPTCLVLHDTLRRAPIGERQLPTRC